MKASELIKELEKYPDFNLEFVISDYHSDGIHTPFIDARAFTITGIGDIGHSDKVIILDGDEQ